MVSRSNTLSAKLVRKVTSQKSSGRVQRYVSDLQSKQLRATRLEAARMVLPPPRTLPSKATLLLGVFLSDPADILTLSLMRDAKLHCRTEAFREHYIAGKFEKEKAWRATAGIALDDGFTLARDRQTIHAQEYLLSPKIEPRTLKDLQDAFGDFVFEEKRVIDGVTGRPVTAHRIRRSKEAFAFLLIHSLNQGLLESFVQRHYFSCCEPIFNLLVEHVMHETWEHIDDDVWKQVSAEREERTVIYYSFVASVADVFLLYYFNRPRHEEMKRILKEDTRNYLEKLLGDRVTAAEIDTLSFLRFIESAVRQRQHMSAHIESLSDASTNASIKKRLEALTIIVLPTIDGIIREYEQRVLAEIQRMTKTQGGKVKKR